MNSNNSSDLSNALNNQDITKLTWNNVLQKVGVITNDNEIADVLFQYMNDGITEINARCSLKFPLVTVDQLNNQINISNDTQVNNYYAQVLISYCAMCLRKAEGYEPDTNTFMVDYEQRIQTFISLYRPYIIIDYVRLDEDDTRVLTADNKQASSLELWAKWKPRI